VAKDSVTLLDHLSPRYLKRVIRIDPWHNPYRYEGAEASAAVADALKKVLLKLDVGEAQIVQAPAPVPASSPGLESRSGSPAWILATALIAVFVMVGFAVWALLPHRGA